MEKKKRDMDSRLRGNDMVLVVLGFLFLPFPARLAARLGGEADWSRLVLPESPW